MRWILSQIFGFAVLIRQLLYRLGLKKKIKVKVPVISVGNITVGGTGKTPLIKELAGYLMGKGLKVAILLHGWRGQAVDEQEELKQSLPKAIVLSNKNRVMKARQAIAQFGAQIILLDDGFQHWQLARDIDIVVASATDPLGGGYLLPRGRLREKPTALKRAQHIVLTRADNGAEEAYSAIKPFINNSTPVLLSVYQPINLTNLVTGQTLELSALKGIQAGVLSAIVDSDYFHRKVAGLGAAITMEKVFPDHYLFTQSDIDQLVEESINNKVSYLITTTKDAPKLKKLKLPNHKPEILVLNVRLKFIKEGDNLGLLVSGIS